MREITPELMEATRNLVRFARITRGDNVLLAVGRGFEDPILEQAILLTVEEKGAKMTMLTKIVGENSGKPGRGDIVKVLECASQAMDFVLCNGLFVTRSNSVEIPMKEYGTHIIRLQCRTAEAMASEHGRFPYEIIEALNNKMLDMIGKAKSVHITTALGTDMTIGVNPCNFFPYGPPTAFPGGMENFPGALFGINSARASVRNHGVFYVEHFESEHLPNWWLEKPVKVTVKDGLVSDAEGPYADRLMELLQNNGNSSVQGGCHFGYHPKAPPVDRKKPPGWYAGRHAGPDMIHFFMGHSGFAAPGASISQIHIDNYLYYPTITVEGTKLIENGRLMLVDDPDIRKIASQFGDPDKLFAPPRLPSVMEEF